MTDHIFIQIKMKKILITILISAFCISMEAQKISALTEATVVDDNSLVMTRVGATGDTIKKISIANLFKDRTLTGTITLPATTSIGSVSDTEIAYVNGTTGVIQTQIDSKIAKADSSSTLGKKYATGLMLSTGLGLKVNVSDTSLMLDPYITDAEARKAINDSSLAWLNGATELSDVAVMKADSTAGAGHYASHYDMTTGLAGKVAASDTSAMLDNYINKADTSTMLTPYARKKSPTFNTIVKLDTDTLATQAYARSYGGTGTVTTDDVKTIIADSAIKISDIRPYFVFGAGTGAAADSTLFAKGSKSFGSFRIIEDSLYVHSITNLYMTSGDSLKFNVYYGNGMTRVATDSLFTAPQGAGSYALQTFTPDNVRTINHDQDVWIGIIGPQPANKRPKEWVLQLNAKIVRD
jgi:hypothetical protein